MEPKFVGDFVRNLDGEISLRDDLIYDLMDKGHKLYLFTRNLTTLLCAGGIYILFYHFSQTYVAFILAMCLLLLWGADYFNPSGQILNEITFLSKLKVMLEEVELMAKHGGIVNEKVFIHNHILRLNCERKNVRIFSPDDVTKRGILVSKKEV